MPPPRASNAYPVEFRAALNRAIGQGELFIPHPKPAAFRLQLYGFTSALRRDGEPELADSCSFYLQSDPPGVWIKLKESTDFAKTIRAALGGVSSSEVTPRENAPAQSEMDALFNRISKG